MSVYVPGYVTATGKTVRAYTRKKKAIRKAIAKGARRPLSQKQIRLLKARQSARFTAAQKKARRR